MASKKWWEPDSLPFHIMVKPTQEKIIHWFDDEDDKHVSDSEFQYILTPIGCSIATICFLFMGFLMTLVFFIIEGDFIDSLKDASFLFIIALIAWLYSWVRPRKKVILHRFTGKITCSGYLFSPAYTITFSRMKAYIHIVLNDNFSIMGKQLKTRNHYRDSCIGGIYDLADDDSEEWWSFYVWYMDKNRPLPPGKAFDKYRQADYERRKSEGFPKPLYTSNIKTPEATKEQRRERRKIGGW